MQISSNTVNKSTITGKLVCTMADDVHGSKGMEDGEGWWSGVYSYMARKLSPGSTH